MGMPRCLLVVFSLAGLAAPASLAFNDREASAGLWDVVAVEMNGRPVDPGLVKLLQVAYRDDGSWAVLFKRRPIGEGTSRNDENATPKTFEMQTLGGRKTKPRRFTGIYRLEGDSRQLCFVPAGMPRPDTFSAPRGSGRILVTLTRATGSAPPRPRSIGLPGL